MIVQYIYIYIYICIHKRTHTPTTVHYCKWYHKECFSYLSSFHTRPTFILKYNIGSLIQVWLSNDVSKKCLMTIYICIYIYMYTFSIINYCKWCTSGKHEIFLKPWQLSITLILKYNITFLMLVWLSDNFVMSIWSSQHPYED